MKERKYICGYCLFILVCVVIVNVVLNVRTAMYFDAIHFKLLMLLICFSAVIFKHKRVIDQLKINAIFCALYSLLAIVICEIYDATNMYFTFEMENYRWSFGIEFIKVIFYSIIAMAMGTMFWWIKKQIVIIRGKILGM